MKNSRIISTLALTVFLFTLLAGCADGASSAPTLPAVTAEPQSQQAAVITEATQPPAAVQATAPALTEAEARAIALEHAGLTEEQVTWLRTQYEIDDGVPQYEVEFHQDRWEYDYEIHAETGQILSFEKDD